MFICPLLRCNIIFLIAFNLFSRANWWFLSAFHHSSFSEYIRWYLGASSPSSKHFLSTLLGLSHILAKRTIPVLLDPSFAINLWIYRVMESFVRPTSFNRRNVYIIVSTLITSIFFLLINSQLFSASLIWLVCQVEPLS